MSKENEEKVNSGKQKEEPKPVPRQPRVVLSPEHYASRQRAHDMKVAKFLAGGEF